MRRGEGVKDQAYTFFNVKKDPSVGEPAAALFHVGVARRAGRFSVAAFLPFCKH